MPSRLGAVALTDSSLQGASIGFWSGQKRSASDDACVFAVRRAWMFFVTVVCAAFYSTLLYSTLRYTTILASVIVVDSALERLGESKVCVCVVSDRCYQQKRAEAATKSRRAQLSSRSVGLCINLDPAWLSLCALLPPQQRRPEPAHAVAGHAHCSDNFFSGSDVVMLLVAGSAFHG